MSALGDLIRRRFLGNMKGPTADLVPADMKRKCRILFERSADIDAFWASQPQTLLHGDPHLGNLFFEGASPGFLDWQVAMSGAGMRDVAYFATVSVEPTLLRRIERDLVERYAARLEAVGIVVDADHLWVSVPGGRDGDVHVGRLRRRSGRSGPARRRRPLRRRAFRGRCRSARLVRRAGRAHRREAAMTAFAGTPSDDIEGVLAPGRGDVTTVFVSLSARDPDGRARSTSAGTRSTTGRNSIASPGCGVPCAWCPRPVSGEACVEHGSLRRH